MIWLCDVGLCDENTRVSFKALEGQTDCIWSMAFSPNGKWLASGSEDETIQLWDAKTGALSAVFEGHTSPVKSVIFSPDSQQLISVGDDAKVLFWGTNTGVLQRTLEFPRIIYDNLFTLLFNGRWLASADPHGTVKLWDIKSGKLHKSFRGPGHTANSVAFSPNGQLAAGYEDKMVRLWDMNSDVPYQNLKDSTYEVSSITFSPDDRHFASGLVDGIVRIWDVNTGALLQTLAGCYKDMYSSVVVFSPNSRWLASVYSNGVVHLWDITLKTPHQTCKGYIIWAWSMTFSPNGRRLALGSWRGMVRLFDANTGALQKTLENYTKPVTATDFLPDSQWAISNPLELCDRCSPAITFSLDSRRLALGYSDGRLLLMDSSTGTLQRVFKHSTASIKSVAFSPNGQYLVSASGSFDGTISLWDTQIGVLCRKLNGHTQSIHSIAFSFDGQWLASGSRDKTVRIWNTNIGTLHKILSGHSHSVNLVAFSPNGQQLASADTGGIVQLWHVNTGTMQQVYAAASTSRLSFNDDSNIVIDRGIIDLSGISEQISTIKSPKPPRWVGLGFSNGSDGSWITWNGDNILWLPPAYRPVESIISQRKVAIGCGSSCVLLIGFLDGQLADLIS